ncbi:MAG: hypothetical protein ABI832_24560, partial [bacterium]
SGTPDSLHGRIFHADGKPAGAEFTIATAAGTDHDNYSLESGDMVALQDGRWMESWIDTRFDDVNFTRSAQLLGRIYNADGTVAVDSFDLAPGPQYVAGAQLQVLADGRVAVRYDTGYVNETHAAFVQILDPRLAAINLAGSALGDQFQATIFGDTINGGNGQDKLAGMAGDDLLAGGAKADTLLGGDGNDTLVGGSDNDLLIGGSGSDALTGAAGDDTLTGGLGRDSFVFGAGAGHDRVTDFNAAQDQLNLQSYHFVSVVAAQAQFTQTADGVEFAFGADSILLLGLDIAAIGAGNLTL